MESEGGLETREQDFPRLNDLLYLVEHFYPLMDSHLTSPRLALLGRFIIHDPLLNREYFPSTVPFFLGTRESGRRLFTHALFFMPYVEHSLHPCPVAIAVLLHLHRLSSLPSRLCLFPVPSLS